MPTRYSPIDCNPGSMPDGETALLCAAKEAHTQIVVFLVTEGGDVNYADKELPH